MAIKKLTLTEDHLKLIASIKFEAFNFGERFNTAVIDDTIREINATDSSLKTIAITEGLESIRSKVERIHEDRKHLGWGIDQYNLFNGTYVLEDVARIIGKYDQMIPGTQEDSDGGKFPPELAEYMYDLYEYIYKNLDYIMSLVLQFSSNGGLTPGTYKCKNYERYWTRVED